MLVDNTQNKVTTRKHVAKTIREWGRALAQIHRRAYGMKDVLSPRSGAPKTDTS